MIRSVRSSMVPSTRSSSDVPSKTTPTNSTSWRRYGCCTRTRANASRSSSSTWSTCWNVSSRMKMSMRPLAIKSRRTMSMTSMMKRNAWRKMRRMRIRCRTSTPRWSSARSFSSRSLGSLVTKLIRYECSSNSVKIYHRLIGAERTTITWAE